MNNNRITNPNNNIVRDCKSRTTKNEKYKSAYNNNHARAVNIDQQLKLEYNGLNTDAKKGTATINGKTKNVYEMAKNRNKKQ